MEGGGFAAAAGGSAIGAGGLGLVGDTGSAAGVARAGVVTGGAGKGIAWAGAALAGGGTGDIAGFGATTVAAAVPTGLLSPVRGGSGGTAMMVGPGSRGCTKWKIRLPATPTATA